MMSKLYHAFRLAHVADEPAREAAEEMAGFEGRFDALDARVAAVERQLAVLTWMVGTVIALTLTILGLMLAHVFKP